MIGAAEDQRVGLAGYGAGGGKRQQVRLGAGIAEAQPRYRGEAGDDRRREVVLVDVRRAERQPVIDRLLQRRLDHRLGMAEHARRVLVDEIHIAVAIDIGDLRSLGRADGEREGAVMQGGTGVAARHRRPRGLVQLGAARIGRRIALLGLGHRRFEVLVRLASGLCGIGAHAAHNFPPKVPVLLDGPGRIIAERRRASRQVRRHWKSRRRSADVL